MMMLKSQHKRDKNMKFPERALRTVGAHTKRHSASLMWRCQREHSLAPSLRDGLKEETDARVPGGRRGPAPPTGSRRGWTSVSLTA